MNVLVIPRLRSSPIRLWRVAFGMALILWSCVATGCSHRSDDGIHRTMTFGSIVDDIGVREITLIHFYLSTGLFPCNNGELKAVLDGGWPWKAVLPGHEPREVELASGPYVVRLYGPPYYFELEYRQPSGATFRRSRRKTCSAWDPHARRFVAVDGTDLPFLYMGPSAEVFINSSARDLGVPVNRESGRPIGECNLIPPLHDAPQGAYDVHTERWLEWAPLLEQALIELVLREGFAPEEGALAAACAGAIPEGLVASSAPVRQSRGAYEYGAYRFELDGSRNRLLLWIELERGTSMARLELGPRVTAWCPDEERRVYVSGKDLPHLSLDPRYDCLVFTRASSNPSGRRSDRMR